MPDIFHDFPINASPARVFEAVSSAQGLDQWWTERASGEPSLGATYELGFGPRYDWSATVTRCVPDAEFELTMVRADAEWTNSRVTFLLVGGPETTQVAFSHTGWPRSSEHYRISCFCWAMYLRLLKRHLEFGETVPYDKRLEV